MQRPTLSGTTNLIDILDRVLDKGLVIAGDIRVSLANVELLTIRIRLLVCSVDKAEQIGLNWWKHDPNLTTQAPARQNRLGAAPMALPLVRRTGRVQGATTLGKTTGQRSVSTGNKRKKK
jgi:gas vesicle protein GvpA/GvpJ/GvpM family